MLCSCRIAVRNVDIPVNVGCAAIGAAHRSGMAIIAVRIVGKMDRMAAGDIGRLIVAHKDRLVRFGFDLLDHIAKRSACVIEVVNQESLSPQEEMTADLLSIVHAFSCRLYGMRKYKRKND